MSSNKTVREELEKIYGEKCMMHEGLKISGYKYCKVKYKGKAIEKQLKHQLTLHHIKPLREGGKTTVDNGAVLCRGCHSFLEETSPEKRMQLNRALIDYKLSIAEVTTKGVQQAHNIDIDMAECMIIPLVENDKNRRIKTNKQRRTKEKEELRRKLEDLNYEL